jgi:hypothetical protein
MTTELELLKEKLSLFENDAAKGGFYTLNRIVNQQIEFLNEFKIKSKISSDDKADMVEYKNAKELWENLPKMISSLNQLRIEMRIDGEEENNISKIVPISPQSISKIKSY